MQSSTMKIYWNDCGRGPHFDAPVDVTFEEADRISTDEVRGVQGNFIGLIDEQDRTIQFYFEEGIPENVDDARHLKTVLMDFPQPDKKGSYARKVMIGEVRDLIEQAFQVGADYRQFGRLTFVPW